MGAAREIVHGTAIAIGGRAVLIRGPSGAGKSDLALRCLSLPTSPLLSQTAKLVADDQVVLSLDGYSIRVEAPAIIRGKIEVRGIGIIDVDVEEVATLALVVDLVAPSAYERMPEPGGTVRLLGQPIACVAIAPFEASAPLKLLMALQRTGDGPKSQG